MALPFPQLFPQSMTLDHGEAQVTEYSAFGVGPVRFRHNSYINGQKFSLTYRALDQASVNLIRNHYTVNSGVAGEFSVPMVLFGGLNVVTAASVFRYSEAPTEVHLGMQLYDVTVDMQVVEGIEMLFVLDGGPAVLAAEEPFSSLAFTGTAPFTLNGSSPDQATLLLNAI